jgi:proteasome lid subunit RPN8/RPN11
MLAAIYHSHPNGPPVPSGTDIIEAFYPEAVSIICSFDGQRQPSLRAFRIIGGRAWEINLAVVDEIPALFHSKAP